MTGVPFNELLILAAAIVVGGVVAGLLAGLFLLAASLRFLASLM